MRKVDNMGSDPVASKLLFAPPQGSDDDLEGEPTAYEMALRPSQLPGRRGMGIVPNTQAAGNLTDGV